MGSISVWDVVLWCGANSSVGSVGYPLCCNVEYFFCPQVLLSSAAHPDTFFYYSHVFTLGLKLIFSLHIAQKLVQPQCIDLDGFGFGVDAVSVSYGGN
jgi:hypothetical protein